MAWSSGAIAGTILARMQALIMVRNMQNQDFCAGGALEVRTAMRDRADHRLAREPEFVVATRDWHPPTMAPSARREADGRCTACVTHAGRAARRADRLQPDRRDRRCRRTPRPRATPAPAHRSRASAPRARRKKVHVAGRRRLPRRGDRPRPARAGFDITVDLDATRPVEVEAGDGELAVAELRAAGVGHRLSLRGCCSVPWFGCPLRSPRGPVAPPRERRLLDAKRGNCPER